LIGLMVLGLAAALPLLWMLLRATPPAPRDVIFAPIRLLQTIAKTAQSPQTTPWWVIVLRMALAALVVLALARPVWRPDPAALSDAPLLVIADDSWAGAQAWPAMANAARSRLEAARADGRSAAILFTAAGPDAAPLQFDDAAQALARLAAHAPRSWASDRARAAERLGAALGAEGAPRRLDTVWIADGLAGAGDAELARIAARAGDLRLLLPPPAETVRAIAGIEAVPDGFVALVRRVEAGAAASVSVTALAADGRAIARAEGVFEAGETEARLSARLPLDLRNQISRVVLDGPASAGAVHLTGGQWARPRVGLVDPEGGRDDQPLLSDRHYAREALADSAELVSGDLETVLQTEPAALVLTDAADAGAEALEGFVEAGGLVVRFAGSRLAAGPSGLLPVRLRRGGRLFGGAMAWDEPQGLTPFPDDSPFAGLSIPDEATVERQVLAEPGPALDARVWARLEDGTPLVTAERRGNGWVVLYHVTAGPDWSSLPLSGLFPAMLERTMALAGGSNPPAPSAGAWRLERMLVGDGTLADSAGDTAPIPADGFAQARAGAETPPGLWSLGAASAALNVVRPGDALEPMSRALPGAVVEVRGEQGEVRFTGGLLAAAIVLLVADTLIALALAGRLPKVRRGGIAMIVAAAIGGGFATSGAEAQNSEDLAYALEVRFAYVMTGDARVDALSRAGLAGLSRESYRRSAVEPADPAGVNIEADEILFFPMLYWPVTADAPALSPAAADKVSAYLQSGGLIVFDTRDGMLERPGGAPHPGLVRILDAVDPPPLQPIPEDHVLGRTFYLLDEFPGRYPGGDVWVEATPEGSARDGVSGLVIGSADWASAWAVDETGRALAPVEGGEFQRELAIRFGVNLAMYALTGNYKADQVHVPAILERLGED
ncbi:MAG: DUF4159 domain-containing protein, partial [Oceanicaulis sp.]